jgi:2',3'-cyclic-nucleotide 2'-phosphodiesterase
MKILCVGDIFAKTGRQALAQLLPQLIAAHGIDCVIVNGENSAGGRGITESTGEEMLQLPIDVMTSGNHIWQHKNVHPLLESGRILRPHNAPEGRPGSGVKVVTTKNGVKVGVINLQGKVHMYESDKYPSPFHVVRDLVAAMQQQTSLIIVDLHAEITAEKRAFGHFLDGGVTCVYGTHTHIQTADEEILPKGTAYITDIGMTGPQLSVIGVRPQDAIRRFQTEGAEKHWKPATENVQLQGIIVTADPESGRATHIERLRVPVTL